MASSPTLPSDLYSEILTRTSFDTVGRCRLVSKQWNHLTYNSSFINQLCNRTKTTYGVFIQSSIGSNHISTFVQAVDNNDISDSKQLSLSFLPHQPVEIEAVHQGILLCVGGSSRVPQYYVCKPTTKEWEQIHNPKTRYITVKTALMVLRSNPLRYKIVRFSESKSPLSKCNSSLYSLRCEVYDSRDRAWKQLNNVVNIDALLSSMPAVSACGSIHWILSQFDSRSVVGIFAFHVEEENWEIFAPPCSAVGNAIRNKLVEYQGHLTWICEGKDSMELWVMQDYKNKVWSQRRIIRIPGLDHLTSFVTLCNNDVALLFKGSYEIIFYKFGDYNSSKIARLDNIRKPEEIFMLQSDSEPTKLKGRLKSRLIVRCSRSIRKKWSPRIKYRLKIAGLFAMQFVQRLKHYLYGIAQLVLDCMEDGFNFQFFVFIFVMTTLFCHIMF